MQNSTKGEDRLYGFIEADSLFGGCLGLPPPPSPKIKGNETYRCKVGHSEAPGLML